MKIEDPKKLKVGQKLHWYDGDTATVHHQTWGAVVVQWTDGSRMVYPHDDDAWNHFKIYE